MLSDINTDKVTNKAGEKANLDLMKAKKLIRLMRYEYNLSHCEVFLIKSLERPVISIRCDH
jgi:hypothetical protein